MVIPHTITMVCCGISYKYSCTHMHWKKSHQLIFAMLGLAETILETSLPCLGSIYTHGWCDWEGKQAIGTFLKQSTNVCVIGMMFWDIELSIVAQNLLTWRVTWSGVWPRHQMRLNKTILCKTLWHLSTLLLIIHTPFDKKKANHITNI